MSGWVLSSSWDDGAPQDLALAERLVAAGWAATFYICRDYDGRPRLSDGDILALASMPGIEIGAHTLTHPDLRRVADSALREEVAGSRSWLEDLLGREVTAFCYPKGLHDKRAARAVSAAGFRLGRTTFAGWTGGSFDPLRMPTTMQFYPHAKATQLRHAAKEMNLRGLRRIAGLEWSESPAAVGKAFIDAASGCAPHVLHVWGHSWEIEDHGLWRELDRFIATVATLDAEAVTNSELVDRCMPIGKLP